VIVLLALLLCVPLAAICLLTASIAILVRAFLKSMPAGRGVTAICGLIVPVAGIVLVWSRKNPDVSVVDGHVDMIPPGDIGHTLLFVCMIASPCCWYISRWVLGWQRMT
jgi:hypothetical protein